MKTIFIAATLAFSALAATANKSSNKSVNFKALQAFEQEFGTVRDVEWNAASKNMTMASFVSDGEELNAFFDEQGYYLATTIARTETQLPAKLIASIRSKLNNAVIMEAVEFTTVDDHAYFIKVKVNGTEKLLKGYSDGFLQEASLKN